MGLRGPPPTPTPILKARGSWRAGERAGEVQFDPTPPKCPPQLGAEAKAEWRRQVKQLQEAGLLQATDRAALALWCEAWGEWCEARTALDKDGYTIKTATGYVQASPWVAIRNGAADRMTKIAAQFGFTPAARARLKAPEQGEAPEENGKSRFFA